MKKFKNHYAKFKCQNSTLILCSQSMTQNKTKQTSWILANLFSLLTMASVLQVCSWYHTLIQWLIFWGILCTLYIKIILTKFYGKNKFHDLYLSLISISKKAMTNTSYTHTFTFMRSQKHLSSYSYNRG